MRKAETRAKLGVALSGGGFRAALFHFGVLAYLAEVGLLRHVEVLSTVSGGSIIGALYYLYLKQLLETKPDEEITDDDYRRLMRKVEEGLLWGVQQNLRMRTFASVLKNWQMRRAEYTRSHRMGELYEEYFFQPAWQQESPDGIPMHRLKIHPYGAPPDFHPRRDNAKRRAKVPILLLNATSLNTGRNWRFEASRMGEPPRLDRQALEIDKVTRLLRPPGYGALPPTLQRVTLGTAVAASTAVPGIFHPLSVSGMYPERSIALVDGGVHDNQGIQGLLDEGCNRLIISDASTPMDEVRSPETTVTAVLLRTNTVMMHRLREEQLRRALDDARAERNVALLHPQDGLPVECVPWQGRQESPTTKPVPDAVTSDGDDVHPTVQRLLARIRTDLDSFTEVEAFSLMHLGYSIGKRSLRKHAGLAALSSPREAVNWRFLAVGPWMRSPTADYVKQLEVGQSSLFKVFRLAPSLSRLVWSCVALCAIFLIAWHADSLFRLHTYTFTWSGWQLLAAALPLLGLPVASRLLRIRRASCGPGRRAGLYRLFVHALLPAFGAVFVHLYLLILDPLFLHLGRIDRLTPPPPPSQVEERKMTDYPRGLRAIRRWQRRFLER